MALEVGKRFVVLRVKARCFNSFLRVHAKLDYVQEDLQQRLVLVVAARSAQHHERFAAFEHKRWR